MIKKEILSFKCQLLPLTPIHIGSGNELSSYEYVIKDNKFYRISVEDFFKRLNIKQKEIFLELIEKEEFIKIRKFIKDNYEEKYGFLYSTNVSKEINKKYDIKIGGAIKKNEENLLSIYEFIENYQGKYIPGSTIKGYFRTAYIANETENLNYNINRNSKVKTAPFITRNSDEDSDKKITAKALGLKKLEPKFDPFRNLTITDTNIIKNMIEIKEVSRVNSKNSNMPMGMHEVTKSLFSTGDNIIFDFNLIIKTFSYTLQEKLGELLKEENPIKELKDLYIESIFEFLKQMSEKILEEDIAFLKKLNNKIYLSNCERIKEYSLKLKENEVLIKIGKGSGFNSKTLNLFNKNKKEIYTRVLVDEYPIGWAVLSYTEN